MRQLEPETLYSINELTGSARDRAVQDARDRREREVVETDINEMIQSVKVFADSLGFELKNYGIYLYERARFDLVDTLGDDRDVEAMVDKINSEWPDEVNGECSLTGTYTDCYIYDHFENIGGTSASTFTNDVEEAVRYAFTKFLDELEDSLDVTEQLIEYADDRGFEFYEDGELYTG